jgi:hypothetical protein
MKTIFTIKKLFSSAGLDIKEEKLNIYAEFDVHLKSEPTFIVIR